VDMHLSHVPQTVSYGFFGKIDYAVVEATEITQDGRVFLSTSIGASPSYLKYADKVIIEINQYHSTRLREMADIMIVPRLRTAAPCRFMIPSTRLAGPMQRSIRKKWSPWWKTTRPTMSRRSRRR